MRHDFHFGPHPTGEGGPWFFRRGGGRIHGGPFGHGFRHGFGRGGMRRRGSTKFDILAVLTESPRHGYDIMLELERRSGSRPSPGSIYPALQMLEDGDFVRGRDSDGKRIFEITDAGRTLLAERAAEESDDDPEYDERTKLFREGASAIRGLLGAGKEAMRSGDPEIMKRVVAIVERARRDVYTLLAEAD